MIKFKKVKIVKIKIMKLNIKEFQKNNFSDMIKIKSFALFFLFLLTGLTFAQVKKNATIIQYDEFVNASRIETKNIKPLRVETLIKDIQSSIYIEFDGVKTYGLKPVSVFTSAKNILNIRKFDIKKENIEILNIRINNFDDLKSNIDLSVFSDFKKLKYIYIISDIKCNNTDVESIVKNIGSYIVLYKIASNS